MSKKYIEVDALIKKLYPLGMGDGNYGINAKAVRVAIDSMATADVVKVVRCKDCKHNVAKDSATVDCICFMADGMEPNDYCSYGERKCEDNGT
jgi:hypothetical protein